MLKKQKKLLREQKRLSRKYESLKLRNKKEKGEATRQNIQKQIAKVQILYQRLSNIRTENIDINFKACSQIREEILEKFMKEEDIAFSRNAQELSGTVNIQ